MAHKISIKYRVYKIFIIHLGDRPAHIHQFQGVFELFVQNKF